MDRWLRDHIQWAWYIIAISWLVIGTCWLLWLIRHVS